MIMLDEASLICDLAETYHIYDYRQHPADRIAIFAVGLSNNSRIKQRLSDSKLSLTDTLLAMIADRLGLLVWFQTKDGQKGKNRPMMIQEMMLDKPKQESQTVSFNSGEEFMKAREELLNKIGGER